MINPQITIKANYNRTVLTIRSTAINSTDWPNIVSSRIDIATDSAFANVILSNTTGHYKVRAYVEHGTPGQTLYGRVTLTKNDSTTLRYKFSFVVPSPVLGTVVDGSSTRYIASLRKMGTDGVLSPRNYANAPVASGPSHIDITASATGEMVVHNTWATPVLVENVTQGTAQVSLAANASTSVAVTNGDIVRVTESSAGVTFRTFIQSNSTFCKGVSAFISYMPSIDKFTSVAGGTALGRYAFHSFNGWNGTITSFPEGSFDLHKITSIGDYAFMNFNTNGALTALPEGSFDTSNITTAGNYVFAQFNYHGALTSLPVGSFDFDNITQVGTTWSFGGFDNGGALTSLPAGSFGFSSCAVVPDFNSFAQNNVLSGLPNGSFHFGSGAVVSAESAFNAFNSYGQLTTLPDYSFNFKINPVAKSMFSSFNEHGMLSTLPDGSMQIASTATRIGAECFKGFNSYGALTELPEGSFDFSRITSTVSNFGTSDAFRSFNEYGALSTLPVGSFSFPLCTTIYGGFARRFNYGGMIASLPVGAFSVNIATASGGNVFSEFNQGGRLVESETDYNPYFLQLNSSALTAYYYDATPYTRTIASGTPFKYYEAGLFHVVYASSTEFTTNLGNSYLSGTAVTFSLVATAPGYIATPSITTEGGGSVAVTDNGGGSFSFTMPKDNIVMEVSVEVCAAEIVIIADAAGTLKISNKWTTPVIVTQTGQTTSTTTVPANSSTDLTVAIDDVVKVTESSAGATFRGWASDSSGDAMGLASGASCHISEMPPMSTFTTDATGTTAPGYFFHNFNYSGALTSLPNGSFNTSSITNIGDNFFHRFNDSGALTSLPAGSFNTSNITTVDGARFFMSFNEYGALTSLPAGSFNTSGLTSVDDHAFRGFNRAGSLVSLPDGSFDLSNLTTVGTFFCTDFDNGGALTSLPVGSFDISNVSTLGAEFFAGAVRSSVLTTLPAGSFNIGSVPATVGFNFFGWFATDSTITSLPPDSFDTSNITNVGDMFFANFAERSEIASFPAGSFDTSNIVTAGDKFFQCFVAGTCKATSLPAGSFRFDSLISVGDEAFSDFNVNAGSGYMTSLPSGSFNFDNLTTVGYKFLYHFNYHASLTSFPAGSFSFRSVTTVGSMFCFGVNNTGPVSSLPAGSFCTSQITSLDSTEFFAYFNYHGSIPRSTSSYNPQCVNKTSSNITAHYASSSSSISPNQPMYYRTS